MSRWLAEGRALGQSLRRFHSLVVAGGSVDAAADVARGIAEAQAELRPVVLGDLFGDAARFTSLRTHDDHHGIVDAFDYGISLTRILRPVDGFENLKFAPTGSDLPDYSDLLAHPRWQRLIASFRETDQLLVVALPVTAPGIEELVYRMDGIVLVDASAPAKVDPARVLANVVLKPEPVAPPPRPMPVPVPKQAPAPKQRPSAAIQERAVITPPPRASTVDNARPTGVFTAFAKPVGMGAGLSIVAAVLLFWLLNGGLRRDSASSNIPGPLAQVVGGPELPAAVKKTASPDPNTLDPADSGAAVYAVQIMSANTEAGANLQIQQDGQFLPAATHSPVEIAGRTWFKVLAGAYTTRGGADSLLTSLRNQNKLDSLSRGIVVRVPYAVRIDTVRRSTTVTDMLINLRLGRQLPVYALEQPNGWVWILAGAFETRSQADTYAEKLRASGYGAEVVLRQGRMF